MIKALIFDFDGVILDTESSDYEAWVQIYEEYNCILTFEEYSKCIGASNLFDPCSYLEDQIGTLVDHDKLRRYHSRKHLELLKEEKIMPGIMEYLKEGKRMGLKIAIASSAPSQWVSSHLDRLRIGHFFDCIRCAEDVENIKPHPDLFIKVLEEFEIKNEEAVIFEDSLNGISAANRAGIFCVAIPNNITKKLCLDNCDLKVESLNQLPLEKLLKLASARCKNGDEK